MARKYSTAQSITVRHLTEGWPEAAVIRQSKHDDEPYSNVKNYHHDTCTRNRDEVIMCRNLVDPSGPGGFRHQTWRIARNGHAWRTL